MPAESVMAEADLTLRRVETSDAPALADLFIDARQAAAPAMPPAVHDDDSIRAWFEELVVGERETWVAERAAVLVGYVIVDPEWLDSLYVRPELTGQGIGSVLMDLVKSLRPDGFALWVFESNVRAQHFYARHGLEVVERTDGSQNEEQAPDIRMLWPGVVSDLRRRIDQLDAELARVLNERAGLTAAIQRFKTVPGQAGRDRDREAEIAALMAEQAPNLGPERIAQIMDVVISTSLEAAESD
ncbi:MAG: GNAT family N-acetyltransferase [Actinomycetes bacterium]